TLRDALPAPRPRSDGEHAALRRHRRGHRRRPRPAPRGVASGALGAKGLRRRDAQTGAERSFPFPGPGFTVTGTSRPAERVVTVDHRRGTTERQIKDGKDAVRGSET